MVLDVCRSSQVLAQKALQVLVQKAWKQAAGDPSLAFALLLLRGSLQPGYEIDRKRTLEYCRVVRVARVARVAGVRLN